LLVAVTGGVHHEGVGPEIAPLDVLLAKDAGVISVNVPPVSAWTRARGALKQR